MPDAGRTLWREPPFSHERPQDEENATPESVTPVKQTTGFGKLGKNLMDLVRTHASTLRALHCLQCRRASRLPATRVSSCVLNFCDCWQATEDTAYVDDDGVRKLKANPLQIGGLLVAQIGGFAILALIGRALGKSS